MSLCNSDSTSFYHVTYRKKAGGKQSVSYLSQAMFHWIDVQKAIRGRVRGEYYIQDGIREEFEKIARSIEAEITITKVSEVEAAYLKKIVGKQRSFMPSTLTGEVIIEEKDSLHVTLPQDLQVKIAGINDAIQRIENHIQFSSNEREMPPVTDTQEILNRDEGTVASWQIVLEGFQLYREIFLTGMDNPITQDGLYAALSEVSTRFGLGENEILDKMDAAFALAKNHARSET